NSAGGEHSMSKPEPAMSSAGTAPFEADHVALRRGEVTVPLPEAPDAGIYFIGRIRTPWRSLKECPRRGDMENGPICRIEIDAHWHHALTGMEERSHLQVLYWMHRARRDLVLQSPRSDGQTIVTFVIRSPLRPNPIASSTVRLEGIEGSTLLVRGLDCLDGTPVVDVKPEVCPRQTAAERPVG